MSKRDEEVAREVSQMVRCDECCILQQPCENCHEFRYNRTLKALSTARREAYEECLELSKEMEKIFRDDTNSGMWGKAGCVAVSSAIQSKIKELEQ